MNRTFLRRSIQIVFLGLFLFLFFYVACPYPASPSQSLSDWTPLEVDPETGMVRVENPLPANLDADWIRPGRAVFLSDANQTPPVRFGCFEIVQKSNETLELKPLTSLPPETMDELSANFGPWTLYENDPETWPNHYETFRLSKTFMPAEWFLYLDPLVALTAILSGSTSFYALFFGLAVVLSSFVMRRCFCAYVCPLGTLFDLFAQFRSRGAAKTQTRNGWRWGILAAVVVSVPIGNALTGFVAPIPIFVRGWTALGMPLQTAWYRGLYQVPPLESGQILAASLLLAMIVLCTVWPRFWCRCLCPTGALLTLPVKSLFGINVDDNKCTKCGRCRTSCDFQSLEQVGAEVIRCRNAACTNCLACVDACPVDAVSLVGPIAARKEKNRDISARQRPERRRLLLFGLGGVLAGSGLTGLTKLKKPATELPLRPPGALPEEQFLASCVRCGQCLQACPNDALQPMNIDAGLDRLWTPRLVPDWSGCEPSCNNCGAACPTGAIVPLSLEEKRKFVIGQAVIDKKRCLPYAGREECQICVDECRMAGYDALEFVRHGTEIDEDGNPVEGSGFLAPTLLAEKCVGCGLCQTRCRAINAVQKGLLRCSAIVVVGR